MKNFQATRFLVMSEERVVSYECDDPHVVISIRSPAALSKALMGEDEEYFRRYVPNRLVYRKVLEEMSRSTDPG